MRKVIVAMWVLWTSLAATAQDIAGEWTGVLRATGLQVRIVFHINKQDTGYSALMDSPDQGVRGIPVASTRFEQGRLTLEVAQPKIEYTGEWKDSVITGTFRQAGLSFPLDMRRGGVVVAMPPRVRPQEP